MTTGQPLDSNVLAELRVLMGSDFDVLVQTFITDSEQRIDSIADAVGHGDATALRRAAHSFKGSSSNMGAARLADLCRRLEEQGRADDLATAPRLLDNLRDEYLAVREALLNM